MRRLLALGLGCLVSMTAYSEDLLTIFDQAVVNDPSVREAGRQLACHVQPVARRRSGPDHGDRTLAQLGEPTGAAHPERQRCGELSRSGHRVGRERPARPVRVLRSEQPPPDRLGRVEVGPGPVDRATGARLRRDRRLRRGGSEYRAGGR